MYDFAVRNLRYVADNLDADHDGWPEGLGNVERTRWARKKLDIAVYLIRGLYDLADMARAKRDGGTYAWATITARNLERRFDATWWDQAVQQGEGGQIVFRVTTSIQSIGEGNYGIAWAAVHQWLGVRPDIGHARAEFVPQVRLGRPTCRERASGSAAGPPTCLPLTGNHLRTSAGHHTLIVTT
jgi:hypothetical protein